MSNRSLSWSAALRDLKADRASRPDIREEPLRTAAGLREPDAPALSSWRGRSGRRYVVGIHPLSVDLLGGRPAVVLAVRRGDIGAAVLIGVEAIEPGADGFTAFRHAARLAGATELHVHRLAETAADRAAVVADLTGPPAPA